VVGTLGLPGLPTTFYSLGYLSMNLVNRLRWSGRSLPQGFEQRAPRRAVAHALPGRLDAAKPEPLPPSRYALSLTPWHGRRGVLVQLTSVGRCGRDRIAVDRGGRGDGGGGGDGLKIVVHPAREGG